MSKSECAAASDPLAWHWARKGAGELEKIEATLNLARQLLASGEVQPYQKGENPFDLTPYPWETAETPAEARRRIFLGTVSDLATGQGHTVWFAAGLAKDENEFRRKLAAHIGHTLANGAEVNSGLEDSRLSRTFLSAPLRRMVEKYDGSLDPAANFFFTSQWHENCS